MSSTAAAALPAEAAPKGKSKLLLILVVVFALLAGGGGGAAWYFHQKAAKEADEGTEGKTSKPAKKADSGKPPVFDTLENFTVNLAGGDHFMQLGIVLQLRDEETAEKVKTYLPQIRNRILLLLSSKTAEELQTPDGKKKLIEEILADAREPLHAEGDNVMAVLLSSLLIQ